jgi:hypothetical protein
VVTTCSCLTRDPAGRSIVNSQLTPHPLPNEHRSCIDIGRSPTRHRYINLLPALTPSPPQTPKTSRHHRAIHTNPTNSVGAKSSCFENEQYRFPLMGWTCGGCRDGRVMLLEARRTSLRHGAELAEADLRVKACSYRLCPCCSIFLKAYAILNDRSNRHGGIPG